MEHPQSLPDLAAIDAAAIRLKETAVVTPLISNPALDHRVQASVLVKAEPLQRTGTFKFRGAFNRLVQLDEEQRKIGVVAFSSGNHAQGVAAAAELLKTPAAILMPNDAPAIKIENTRAYGAEVVLYDRATESREELAAALARERGAVLVPSFDDPYIIAGQGTVGLEMVHQSRSAGRQLDAAIIPCGGGGLIAGSSVAIKELSPETRLWSSEPEGFDDTRRSLETGTRQAIHRDARSFCDALLAPTPGELTFAINRKNLSGGCVVSDEEVARAMVFAFRNLKIVVEPGGAVALAALLSGKLTELQGKTVGVVLSGGNVDAALFAECLGRYPRP